MLKKFIKFMIAQKNKGFVFFFIFLSSCVSKQISTYDFLKKINRPLEQEFVKIKCTRSDEEKVYQFGDLVCTKENLKVSSIESLKIRFKVTDKKSLDVYKHGYQELLRYRNGKIVEKIKLRRDEDAYWSEVPFVRIRNTYLTLMETVT